MGQTRNQQHQQSTFCKERLQCLGLSVTFLCMTSRGNSRASKSWLEPSGQVGQSNIAVFQVPHFSFQHSEFGQSFRMAGFYLNTSLELYKLNFLDCL